MDSSLPETANLIIKDFTEKFNLFSSYNNDNIPPNLIASREILLDIIQQTENIKQLLTEYKDICKQYNIFTTKYFQIALDLLTSIEYKIDEIIKYYNACQTSYAYDVPILRVLNS